MGESHSVAERVDGLLQQIAGLPLPRARALAEDIVRELMQLYGSGLHRMLDMVHEAGQADLLLRFCDDPLVSSLIILHGLHPLSLCERVQAALDKVRPYLGSHGGNVRLVSVQDGVVRLRLEGSCDGCPSSTVTIKLAVERAIQAACPEVLSIEVEGQTAAAALPWDLPAGEPVWQPVSVAVEAGQVVTTTVDGISMALCRLGDSLYAYLNRCPDCQRKLGEASVRQAVLVCLCGQRYDIRKAGRGLLGGPSLTPLPLQTHNGHTRVAMTTQPERTVA